MVVFFTKNKLSKIKEKYEINKLQKKGTTANNYNINIEKSNNNDYKKNLKLLFLKCNNTNNFNEINNYKIIYILFKKRKSCELLQIIIQLI